MHAPETADALFNQTDGTVEQESQDTDGQDGCHEQIGTQIIAGIDDQEAQARLRANHLSGNQEYPGCSQGEMESGSNAWEDSGEDNLGQDMG